MSLIKTTICLTLSLFSLLPSFTIAYNCTSNEFTTFVSSNLWRVFVFNCYPVTSQNQLIPSTFSSQATKYNEIDMSPNVYTFIPISQLCPFRYIQVLDMSYNRIQSASNAFKDLACLTGLRVLNLANNLINSPILSSDFDDLFSAQLESLNLTSNLIPYIKSASFIKSDGSSRFPNLKYLGLAMNRLKDLDLLWPLTLPQPNLLIDIKLNNISGFVNDLNLSFNNILFKYPMINNRILDATTNSLQGFDDFTILQYGLHNENHLREFLYKISNYDFRQWNNVPTFICYCPPTYGQLTFAWFKLISNLVDRTRPIYQIYCSNTFGSVFVLEYACNKDTTRYSGPATTTYSTLQPFVFEAAQIVQPTSAQSSSTQSTVSSGGSVIGNQVAVTTAASNSTGSSSQIDNNYFYLFFLFIPFFFILCLIFICCIGRCCQLHTNSMCNLVCCPCFRPYDESQFTSKAYDATICYNRSDENWLEEDFITNLAHHRNSYKIHKLSMSSKTSEKTNKEIERILRLSKRIVLIFTQEFIEQDFKNKFFTNLLRNLKDDPNCVIIAINKELDRVTFNNYVKYLNSPFDPVNPRYRSRRSIFSIMKSRIKYNCGLREVEKLDFNKRNFWRNFFYIMPFSQYETTKPAIIIEYEKQNKLPGDPKLSYPTDVKGKAYRPVLIPIPDFMRTKLGFKKNKDQVEENRYNYQQQDVQNNIFYSSGYGDRSAPTSTRMYKDESRSRSRESIRIREKSPHSNQLSIIEDRSSARNFLPSKRDIEVMQRTERSESADILAMFAPAPNTVFPLKQKSKKSSKKSKKVYDGNNSN